MRGMRRKEKEFTDRHMMDQVLREARHITIAMCESDTPYLVTLTHGYDQDRNAIYFHCAREGKKVDILKSNNVVWGQALLDKGYVEGCDHFYITVQFQGAVAFVDDLAEKRHALGVIIQQHEPEPETVLKEQVTEDSVGRVNIGRIDIGFMSGKRSENVVISL